MKLTQIAPRLFLELSASDNLSTFFLVIDPKSHIYMTFIAGFRQERFSSVDETFLLGYYSNLPLSRDSLTAGEFTSGGFAPYIRVCLCFG